MTQITGTVTGGKNLAGVTSDKRLLSDSVSETISGERSRAGKLFGAGSGFITTKTTMDHLTTAANGSVFWLRNNSTDENIHIQKLIYGWNGGSTNYNKTLQSRTYYNTGEPTGNNITNFTDQIENISLSGSSPVESGKTTIHVWDGTGNGMTVGSGGFIQMSHQYAPGPTDFPIDGEIILGPGDSIEFRIDSSAEAGLYNCAIIYYFAPINGGRSAI